MIVLLTYCQIKNLIIVRIHTKNKNYYSLRLNVAKKQCICIKKHVLNNIKLKA